MSRPPWALASVVLLLAAGFAVAQATEPDPSRRNAAAAEQLPVLGRLVVCPELVKEGSDVKTRLTAGSPTAGALSARATRLVPGSGLGQEVLDRGGGVGLLRLHSDDAIAVALSSSGELAGTVEAEQLSRGADGPQRGWANVRCEPTTQDAWFVGGTTTQSATTHLILVNPYDEPALVNLYLYTKSGLVDAPGARGIVVARRSRHVLNLARLVPEERALAVRVETVEGRVSPAMREARAKGDLPLGVDWVPRAGSPSSELTIPGVPDGIGNRTLFLFTPGEDDAVVRIQTTYEDGQFVPDGLEEVVVPAGRVKAIDLTPIVSFVDQQTADRLDKPVTLRILADGAPVLASVLAENNARFSHIREVAYAGPVRPLAGPSLVTDNVIGDRARSVIYLTSPDGTGRVTISLVPYLGETGAPKSYTLNVPQGRVVAFQIRDRFPGARTKAVVVVPDPGSAPIYAARYLVEQGQRGPLITVLGLVSQPGSGVPAPVVLSDPRTALVDPRED